MFKPNQNLKIKKNSGFLTFSSLEQMGVSFKAFVDFAIQKKVSIFVTVDSIEELYDKKFPIDRLALRFIKSRGYLSEYLTYLQKLENAKKIKILKAHRIYFGNQYHDGYSYIAWRPVPHPPRPKLNK